MQKFNIDNSVMKAVESFQQSQAEERQREVDYKESVLSTLKGIEKNKTCCPIWTSKSFLFSLSI